MIQQLKRMQKQVINKLVPIHKHALYIRMASGYECGASNQTTEKPAASPEALEPTCLALVPGRLCTDVGKM
jgi:hypothetical protein